MRHSIQSNFLVQKEDNLLEDYLKSMLQYNKAKLLQKTKSLEQKRNESIDSFFKNYFKKFFDQIKITIYYYDSFHKIQADPPN